MTAAIALVLSGVAVALSAGSLAFNVRSRRRDLFLDMHERLLDDQIRRGRRALLEASIASADDARAFKARSPEEYEIACRALAMLDVLGCYVYRGYVDKRLVLDEWGHTYAQLWITGQHIVAMRLEHDQGLWSAWPNFQRFGSEALRWTAQQPPRGLRQDDTRGLAA